MVQKAILIAMLICCFAVIDVRPIKADDATAASTSSTNEKIPLAKVAPELHYQLRRYPKFYGDENTVHGGLFERSFLLDKMLEKGYSETDCGKFLGANMYRVMKKFWI